MPENIEAENLEQQEKSCQLILFMKYNICIEKIAKKQTFQYIMYVLYRNVLLNNCKVRGTLILLFLSQYLTEKIQILKSMHNVNPDFFHVNFCTLQ